MRRHSSRSLDSFSMKSPIGWRPFLGCRLSSRRQRGLRHGPITVSEPEVGADWPASSRTAARRYPGCEPLRSARSTKRCARVILEAIRHYELTWRAATPANPEVARARGLRATWRKWWLSTSSGRSRCAHPSSVGCFEQSSQVSVARVTPERSRSRHSPVPRVGRARSPRSSSALRVRDRDLYPGAIGNRPPISSRARRPMTVRPNRPAAAPRTAVHPPRERPQVGERQRIRFRGSADAPMASPWKRSERIAKSDGSVAAPAPQIAGRVQQQIGETERQTPRRSFVQHRTEVGRGWRMGEGPGLARALEHAFGGETSRPGSAFHRRGQTGTRPIAGHDEPLAAGGAVRSQPFGPRLRAVHG